MSPHLFRDAAATSIVIEDPEHVRIIAAINGHRSLRTDEKHYIQATGLEAGREYQQAILARRRRHGAGRRHRIQPSAD